MTKPHPVQLALTGLLMLLSGLPLASRAGEPLIVVEDRGGTSALPYYEALNLQPRANAPAPPPHPPPPGGGRPPGSFFPSPRTEP
ncbi:integrating conjugative element protein, partial [Pseudomonas aeruginosa]|uniref:integrating conjugative element protein n=1 Tax=Pseudomonas aeruginosa TaxID=287 RepID=UPI0020CC6BFD